MKKTGKYLAGGTMNTKSFSKTQSCLLSHNFFRGIYIQEILAKEHEVPLAILAELSSKCHYRILWQNKLEYFVSVQGLREMHHKSIWDLRDLEEFN